MSKISKEVINKINYLLTLHIFKTKNSMQCIKINYIFTILDNIEKQYGITLYYEESIDLVINYINRIKNNINMFNYEKYFIICLVIAQKVIFENPFSNQSYVLLYQDIFDNEYFQPLQEFNYTEIQVLELLNWNVYENILKTI